LGAPWRLGWRRGRLPGECRRETKQWWFPGSLPIPTQYAPARGLQDMREANSPFARNAEVRVGTIATACLGRRGSWIIQGRAAGGREGFDMQRRINNESDHYNRKRECVEVLLDNCKHRV